MNKKSKSVDPRPFSERHPYWNLIFAFFLLGGMIWVAIIALRYIIDYLTNMVCRFVEWISTMASTLDAVVIVLQKMGGICLR